MAHFGVFIEREMLDYIVDGGPRTLIIADTEIELWQHIFDLVATHLRAGADNTALEFAGEYRKLLDEHPPTPAIRADVAQIQQWLDHCDGWAEVFYLVFDPEEVQHLASTN